MPRSQSIQTQEEIENPEEYGWTGIKNPTAVLHEIEFASSTLETIDFSVYDFLNETLNLSLQTNEGFKKVPIIWASAERSFQIKANRDLRDSEEALILPLIAVERMSVIKDPTKRAIPYANLVPINDPKGGTVTIARRINQKKTSEFEDNLSRRRYSNTKGRTGGQDTFPGVVNTRTVYETISIPMPIWVSVTYQISLRTEYQLQMNDLITPFIRKGGLNRMPARLSRDGHKYEAFIEGNFANNSNVGSMEFDQRNYETKISMEVLGYLVGDGPNEEKPKIVIRENAVEVKIPREHVILGDINEYLAKEGFYKP
jgi:hypothetical protein